MTDQKTSYQLPELPYDFSAIEPVISAKIMEIHYTKHHKGYVTNLNAALEKYHEAETHKKADDMIALQDSIRDFDGTFTYLVSTSRGIGYAKDKLAAKPLVVMERDDVVALASEEVALRQVFTEEIQRTEPQQSLCRVWLN